MSNSYYKLCVNTARAILVAALLAAKLESAALTAEMQALLDNFDSAASDVLDALNAEASHHV